MNGRFTRACSALACLALLACASAPRERPVSGAEARNATSQPKKRRKPLPPPVLAPPPAYGNKIVYAAEADVPLPIDG